MSYLARVANRTNSAGPTPISIGARPAKAIDSPLVEEDQRLNLDPGEVFASAPTITQAPVSLEETDLPDAKVADQIGPLPEAPAKEETPQDMSTPDTFAPAPLTEVYDDPPLPESPNPSTAGTVQVVDGPAPPPVDAMFEETSDPLEPEVPAPRPITKAKEKERRPDNPQTTPLASMMKAVAIAERWVSEDPTAPEVVQPRQMEREVFVPRDQQGAMGVQPILPETMEDRPQQPVPRGPTVEIGQIEIEVVPPPAPAQPRPVSSRPAAPPAPKPAMPFGWRQR